MSLLALLVVVAGGVMLVAFVALVLLWAFTEEMPRADRVPFYERMEPGAWSVRLERVGRRRMKTMRLVNEVLGGDLAAARSITDHPPSLVVEGVSEALAQEIVAALAAAGSVAVAVREG